MDFKEILIQNYKFSTEDWETTIGSYVPATIKANDYFLKFGDISDKLGIVMSGILRTYYTDKNDNDITTDFILSGNVVISNDSFNKQIPSKENIIAIENTELLIISYKNIQELYKKIPAWQLVCKDTADYKNNMLTKRTIQFQTLTATERYKEFCKQYPEVCKKVALKHIASYLGIDIATLSRIRKKK